MDNSVTRNRHPAMVLLNRTCSVKKQKKDCCVSKEIYHADRYFVITVVQTKPSSITNINQESKKEKKKVELTRKRRVFTIELSDPPFPSNWRFSRRFLNVQTDCPALSRAVSETRLRYVPA